MVWSQLLLLSLGTTVVVLGYVFRGLTRNQLLFIGGAVAVHLVAYVILGRIPKTYKPSTVAIALAEAKKKDDQQKEKEKEKNKPPPKAKDAQAAKAKAPSPKPTAVEAPPPPTPINNAPPPVGDAPGAMEGFADLGMTMGGGGGGVSIPGGGGGGGGGGAGGHGGGPLPVATQKQAVKQLAATDPGCTEDLVKPKLEHQVQPSYTPQAQQAGVEGKVRLEVTVDATGHVTQVKVLNGLGFGLDENAVAAVKQYTFTAATKCGKAVPTTIKMGISFGLK